jgi:peptide deformylase
MALRTIVKEGDPILNKVCRPVTKFDDRLATLLDDMHETMLAADGVGLAGPQVGMLRRLFVVWDTTDCPEEIPADYDIQIHRFRQPEIFRSARKRRRSTRAACPFPGTTARWSAPCASRARAGPHGNGSSWRRATCWAAASSTKTTTSTA